MSACGYAAVPEVSVEVVFEDGRGEEERCAHDESEDEDSNEELLRWRKGCDIRDREEVKSTGDNEEDDEGDDGAVEHGAAVFEFRGEPGDCGEQEGDKDTGEEEGSACRQCIHFCSLSDQS